MRWLVAWTTLLIAGCVSADPVQTDIEFCHFDPPGGIKQGRANFSLIYEFELDGSGKVTDVRPLISRYVDSEEVAACIKRWTIAGLSADARLVAVFRWVHGEGWVSLGITGDGYDQVIRITGDRCPYP